MKHKVRTMAFIFALFGMGIVQAATINYETRIINNGVNNLDYRASWNAQTSAITVQNIIDFTDKPAGNNTFSHLVVDFDSDTSNVLFQFEVDAG